LRSPVAPREDDVYSFEWIVSSSGIHRFTAVALERSRWRGAVESHFVRGNAPASVAFTKSCGRRDPRTAVAVQLTVEATDPDGTVVAVLLFRQRRFSRRRLRTDFNLSFGE